MPGAKIPVLEIEKLTLTKGGRGLNFLDDGTTFKSGGVWGNTIETRAVTSGGLYLAAASATAWIKVTYSSGTQYAGGVGYIPVMQNYYGGGG